MKTSLSLMTEMAMGGHFRIIGMSPPIFRTTFLLMVL